MRAWRCVFGLLLAWQLAGDAGQNHIDQLLDSLFAAQQLRQPSISPDGRFAAWVQNSRKTPEQATLYFTDLSNASVPPKRVSHLPGVSESDPAWSQDGKLAFISHHQGEAERQIWLCEKPGHTPPHAVASVQGFIQALHWSPDGRQLAVLVIENAPRRPGATQPEAPDVGVIENKIYLQRIAIVNLATGKLTMISPPGMYVYEYDWSPDGKQIAYTAAQPPGDDNWWVAQLYRLNIQSGSAKALVHPSLQIANPRWSPDGRKIGYIGGLMSDEGVTGGDIYTVAADGGEPVDITPGRKSSPSWFTWLGSSNTILFLENVRGQSGIRTLDPATSAVRDLWTGPETVSFAGNDRASVIVRSSFLMPQEVWGGAVGTWRQITSVNRAQKHEWGEAKSIAWKDDGFDVQGWLVFPAHYDPSRKYPMIVSVHGGPASERNSNWPSAGFELTLMSAEDYFVFFPNPRGSYGHGEDFTRANVKDFGYGDLRDILAGVDEVVKTYPIDQNRIGIGGWSYGGYMTMWAVTQTNRFRAAVAGAGIANWQSYYGENDIDQWMIPYFGASVYDDPEVYARSAPITYIKNVKTPTLVLVGERDGECPSPQSHEFWHALRTFGVKTSLVIYPGEGHSFREPEHIRDLLKRTLAWFDENMRAAE